MGPKTPAEVYRAARRSRAWSQFKLAVEAGISPQTVSLLERGASVSEATHKKIAAALGLKKNGAPTSPATDRG